MRTILILTFIFTALPGFAATAGYIRIEGTKIKSTGQTIGKALTSDGAGGASWGAAGMPASGVGLVEVFTGHYEAPTDKTYVLDQSAAYAYTINTIKVVTVSGTATAAVKINGTSVTGISAVSVTSTVATGTASAANSVAIGDKVTLVISSSATPIDLSFTMKYTR